MKRDFVLKYLLLNGEFFCEQLGGFVIIPHYYPIYDKINIIYLFGEFHTIIRIPQNFKRSQQMNQEMER